jgi:hypothetical protein
MFGGIRPPPCSFRQTFLQVSLHHAHMSSLGEHFFEQKNAFFRKSEMEAPRTILIFCFHLVEAKRNIRMFRTNFRPFARAEAPDKAYRF